MNYRLAKLTAHLLCWFPLVYLVIAVIHKRLGADPQESMLHLLGFWSLVFLLTGLSLTPLNRAFSFPVLIKFRRMFGLYAGFYVLLHITMFFVFYVSFDFNELILEVFERPYITVGMLAFVFMLPLIITSTKRMQRILGRRWKQLHRLAYPISVLAIIHFIWQSKSDLNEPLIYAIWLALVIGFRIYWSKVKN